MFEELEKFKKHQTDIQVTEIKINLPSGGFIAGKWWGNLNHQPILCMHGLLDNAGTFDRLIPLLPKQFSFLAIDSLGHGKSSWFSDEGTYNPFDNISLILFIMKEYNWDKVSLLCHCMGATISTHFASLFPEKVNFLILIEALKKFQQTSEEELTDVKQIYLNSFKRGRNNLTNMEPTSYSIEELIERVYTGFHSITEESAPYFLERNIKKSSKNPSKFYFSRDPKLNNIKLFLFLMSEKKPLEMVKNLKNIPILFLTTNQTSSPFQKMECFENFLGIMKQYPKFRLEFVNSSSHHFHLNSPEIILKTICEFLLENVKLPHHL